MRHPRVAVMVLEDERDRLADALIGLLDATATEPSAKIVGSDVWCARHKARLAAEYAGFEVTS